MNYFEIIKMNQLFGMNFFKVFDNFYILQISCVFILNILLQNIILPFLGEKKYQLKIFFYK